MPINIPLGFNKGDIQSLKSSCYFVSRNCSCLFVSSSSFSLAIRVKERECVQVVFEGDKLIQVILLFLLSITWCFHLLFTYLF